VRGVILARRQSRAAALVAAVLIAGPFLFGFSDEGAPTAVFIVGGVLAVLITIATRFLPSRDRAPT